MVNVIQFYWSTVVSVGRWVGPMVMVSTGFVAGGVHGIRFMIIELTDSMLSDPV